MVLRGVCVCVCENEELDTVHEISQLSELGEYSFGVAWRALSLARL